MTKYVEKLKQCLESIKRKEIPDCFPAEHDLFDIEVFKYRTIFTEDYGMWAMVDKTWTGQLADSLRGKRVLEVCAGSGWLAKALREHGIEVIATDIKPFKPVTEVITIDAVAAVKYYVDQYDVLLISWPPFNEPIAEEVIDALEENISILYIGEPEYGCTANDAFFQKIVFFR